MQVAAEIEYDGYMIFDCEIRAKRDLSVEQLTLEIPVLSRHATLCLGMYAFAQNREIPMKRNYSGAVHGDLSFRFSPNVWLGDEQRGLCWQAETDQDWHYGDPQKAIEILPRGETTTFRAHWVDVPTRLAEGESLHYKFALLATPTKPILRDAWDLRIARTDPYGEDLNLPDRKTDGSKPTLQHYAEAGVRHLFTQAHDICPYPMPVTEGYPEALRRLIEATHAHGLKLYPYLFHQRFPITLPEFDIHGLHMSKLPLVPWAWGGVQPPPNYPGYYSDIFTDYGFFCTTQPPKESINMPLADVGWIWEGQGFDPGVRPSIYGLGQGAAYMGLTRANFMFHPNDEHALQLMSHLDEVTCDISKWDYEWGESNSLRSVPFGDPPTVRREAEKVAKLSLRHANVTGAFHDDVMGLMTRHDMTARQFSDVRQVMREINPQLTVVYTHELDKAEFWQPLSPYIDVVNLWIWESKHLVEMPQQVLRCRALFPDKPIVMGMYLRDYHTATPVPLERVKQQMQLVADGIDREALAGYSILGTILIEGQREQADALRDFIASH